MPDKHRKMEGLSSHATAIYFAGLKQQLLTTNANADSSPLRNESLFTHPDSTVPRYSIRVFHSCYERDVQGMQHFTTRICFRLFPRKAKRWLMS